MDKTIKVKNKYRTNKLSIQPGGFTVCVQYKNNHIREYDKIKNPYAYIKNIEKNSEVKKVWIKQ